MPNFFTIGDLKKIKEGDILTFSCDGYKLTVTYHPNIFRWGSKDVNGFATYLPLYVEIDGGKWREINENGLVCQPWYTIRMSSLPDNTKVGMYNRPITLCV